jgi:GNAT superfamily N-acetyltransferase
MNIEVQRFSGSDIRRYIPELARLRLSIFRDYPYLYDGDLQYEERYLSTYLRSDLAVMVVAFDEGRIIGASSGMPLEQETDEIKMPLIAAGFNPEAVFYFGESLLEKPYRGQGVGHRFFDVREQHAHEAGRFTHTAFMAVQRTDDHPRKPKIYSPLDQFWKKRGYTPRPDITTQYAWKDLDEPTESLKPMMFWIRSTKLSL